MSTRTQTPSIVPEASDTVYLVLDDFGPKLGRAWVETEDGCADLETIIDNLSTGQYSSPVRIAAFNLAAGWAKDVSRDLAKEVLERAQLRSDDLPESTREFVKLTLAKT